MKTAPFDIDTGLQNGGGCSEWSLLLSRIESAAFDSDGQAFVKKAARNSAFWQGLEPEELLRGVRVLQQHGLHAQSLEIMEMAHVTYPESEPLWREHLETLMLLGHRDEMLKLRARAASHVQEEEINRWISGENVSYGKEDYHDDIGFFRPFSDLRREERQITAYMNIFTGRHDAFARQWADRDQQRQGYVPVRRPMTAADVKEHISGSRTYGIYLLEEDSTVHIGVIDIDLVMKFREPAAMKEHRSVIRREAEYVMRRFAALASDAGLRFIPEASGGKGYHLWFPVCEPVPAEEMRAALQGMAVQVKDDIQCFGFEVFPKQDRLTGKGFGNLVKLPLGIHRVTGKRSWFLGTGSRDIDAQLEYIAGFKPADPDAVRRLASDHDKAEVVVHPRHARWAEEYPELASLEVRCPMLGQIFAAMKASRTLGVKEEKVLLGTLAHLSRGRTLLHHLFSRLPEYNRPLLDYKISKVRGTPLGCKRIHSLLDASHSELPCSFEGKGYPHPLRHLSEYEEGERCDVPLSEKVQNLEDAIENLKTALRMVERFL